MTDSGGTRDDQPAKRTPPRAPAKAPPAKAPPAKAPPAKAPPTKAARAAEQAVPAKKKAPEKAAAPAKKAPPIPTPPPPPAPIEVAPPPPPPPPPPKLPPPPLTIADVVVAKMAGLAARAVPGVHRIGGSATAALVTVRSLVPGVNDAGPQAGITVASGDDGSRTIGLDLVCSADHPVGETVGAVRAAVIEDVERATGLAVTSVDVTVVDLHVPEDTK